MHDVNDRFREAIRAALGYAPDVIEPGKLHRFATRDRRGDDAGWCKLFDDMGGGVFGCNRSGVRETWTAGDRHSMTLAERAALTRQIAAAKHDRERQQRDEWAITAKRNASLWAQCMPVTDSDPVQHYLCRRLATDAFEVPPCLRLHPALDHWHDGARIGAYPAMVAPVTAPDGRVVALHQTYLTDDGRKADVPGTEKKVSRTAGLLRGASIRLASPRAGVLGIAEGIETALAASVASGVPTVAAYCAGVMAGFRWPAGLRRLVVFADNDKKKTGQEAADALRVRAIRAGLSVKVMTPTEPGTDWADVWQARQAATLGAAA